ncbi:MAG: hypothetical protein FWH12_01230 [Treponema sp.]|nr:hypothetical protein [Treponema sp.]
MAKAKLQSPSSALGIFFFYIIASALVIMAFRFFVPGEPVPLAFFSLPWRLIQGFLSFLDLFPALCLSALVIPFGFKVHDQEDMSPFSAQFLQSLSQSITTAICATALYGLLFFLALPLAQDFEANILYESRLYRLSRERAQEFAELGEWNETYQFLGICESIWPGSPELARLRTETEIQLEAARMAGPYPEGPDLSLPGLPGARPLTSTEALVMAETALGEERYFDAHWLATLGSRLSPPGSAEVALARRLEGLAWNGINSLEPNARESRAYMLFRLKREGYEALLAEEWIRAYYIFLDLLEETPHDPDVLQYLELSEEGVTRVAFFIDEIEFSLGRVLTGALYSIPYDSGRLVIRFSSISKGSDSAYATGIEILAFDQLGQILWGLDAPFAKVIPLSYVSRPGVAILLRALDRDDNSIFWEPVTWGLGYSGGPASINLPLSWDTFLLLAEVPRGLSGLTVAQLRRGADFLGPYGHLPQVFEAEILRRFSHPLLLLPLSMFTIVLGWRFRARIPIRYIGFPMLFILPVIFNGAIQILQIWIHNLGVWAVITMGFFSAALVLGLGALVLFIISLIVLAAQHG